ncbi:hypothetical protein P5705_14105 [Pseudomonas entomophila]|uniref:hypothetical protein n=1 Tax=Pseudomonas entomophila TaxID=312306 RepID=UPI002405A97E|nr:hypothetical protein [Pseudomonas entomophila]MDF9618781.1 hypothetical protein [Pseudomonas entomophila]
MTNPVSYGGGKSHITNSNLHALRALTLDNENFSKLMVSKESRDHQAIAAESDMFELLAVDRATNYTWKNRFRPTPWVHYRVGTTRAELLQNIHQRLLPRTATADTAMSGTSSQPIAEKVLKPAFAPLKQCLENFEGHALTNEIPKRSLYIVDIITRELEHIYNLKNDTEIMRSASALSNYIDSVLHSTELSWIGLGNLYAKEWKEYQEHPERIQQQPSPDAKPAPLDGNTPAGQINHALKSTVRQLNRAQTEIALNIATTEWERAFLEMKATVQGIFQEEVPQNARTPESPSPYLDGELGPQNTATLSLREIYAQHNTHKAFWDDINEAINAIASGDRNMWADKLSNQEIKRNERLSADDDGDFINISSDGATSCTDSPVADNAREVNQINKINAWRAAALKLTIKHCERLFNTPITTPQSLEQLKDSRLFSGGSTTKEINDACLDTKQCTGDALKAATTGIEIRLLTLATNALSHLIQYLLQQGTDYMSTHKLDIKTHIKTHLNILSDTETAHPKFGDLRKAYSTLNNLLDKPQGPALTKEARDKVVQPLLYHLDTYGPFNHPPPETLLEQTNYLLGRPSRLPQAVVEHVASDT